MKTQEQTKNSRIKNAQKEALRDFKKEDQLETSLVLRDQEVILLTGSTRFLKRKNHVIDSSHSFELEFELDLQIVRVKRCS